MVDKQHNASDQSQSSRNTGLVYVLTHPRQDGIKIGTTQNLSQRMKKLYNTSVPGPFECLYAARVHDPKAWEKTLHYVFEDSRIDPKREFFSKDIADKVIRILKTAQIENASYDAEDVRKRRERLVQLASKQNLFNFEMPGIPVGAELQFIHNSAITCTVTSRKPPKVNFRGEELPLHRATHNAFVLESPLPQRMKRHKANEFDAINKGDPFDAISQLVNVAEALLSSDWYEGDETMAIDEASSMHDLTQGQGCWRYDKLTLLERRKWLEEERL